jgi:hypothetical protein
MERCYTKATQGCKRLQKETGCEWRDAVKTVKGCKRLRKEIRYESRGKQRKLTVVSGISAIFENGPEFDDASNGMVNGSSSC